MSGVTPQYLRERYPALRGPEVPEDDLCAACDWFNANGCGRDELVERGEPGCIPYSVLLGLHGRGSLACMLAFYCPKYPCEMYQYDEKRLVGAGGLTNDDVYENEIFNGLREMMQWWHGENLGDVPRPLVTFYSKYCRKSWRERWFAQLAGVVPCARPFVKSGAWAKESPFRRPTIMTEEQEERHQVYKQLAGLKAERCKKALARTQLMDADVGRIDLALIAEKAQLSDDVEDLHRLYLDAKELCVPATQTYEVHAGQEEVMRISLPT